MPTDAVMKSVVTTCLLLLLSLNAHAYTLEELMKMAVENRDVVKRSMTALEQRGEDVRFFRGNFLPSADVGYTVNRLDDDTLTESEKNSIISGVITWNVFAGFRDTYDYNASKHLYEAAEYELAGIRQDIQLLVALGLLNVYRSRAYLEVVENSLRLYQERHEEARLKHRVGILKKADVLKIKVVLDDAAQDVREARASLSKNLNNLVWQTGLQGPALQMADLDFGCFGSLPETRTYEAYEPMLLEGRSELNALRQQEEAAQLQIRSARAALYPRTDVSLGYQNYEDDYLTGTGDETEDEVRLQMTFSMNLFDGFQKYTGIRKARLASKSVRYQLNELERQFRTELRNILKDLDVAFKNYDVARESLAEAEENLRINELSFKKGVATATDILDAIFYLSQARFNIINAEYGIFSNYYRLTRMIDGFDRHI